MLVRIEFIISGILIGLWLLNKASHRLPSHSPLRYHLSYLVPLLQLLAWTALFVIFVEYLVLNHNDNILITIGVVFLFVAFPLFYYIRDLLVGLYLKMKFHLMPGQVIIQETIKREIVRIGIFNMTLKNRNNQPITISYSKINPEWIIQRGSSPVLIRHLLMFQIPASGNIERRISKMMRLILDSPWHATAMTPVIEQTSRQNGTLRIEVVVYVLYNKDAKKIRDMIRGAINKNRLN